MDLRKVGVAMVMAVATLAAGFTYGAEPSAPAIILTSPVWIGKLNLDQMQLDAVRQAVESALTAPIDAEQQCGQENGLCVVRAAREWMRDGIRYREIVINIHTVGHAQQTVKQVNGAWPTVLIQ